MTYFLKKVAKIDDYFWGKLKSDCNSYRGNFRKNLGYFLFHHLVTLMVGHFGRVVASNKAEDPGLNAGISEFYEKHLFNVNYILKTEIKIKRPRMAHF